MTTNEILCSNILRLRKEKGLSQSMLAEKLQITFQSVSKWENNLSCPDISLLPAIADVLEVSIDELFGKEPVRVPAASADADAQEIVSRPIDDTLVNWPDDDKLHVVMFKGHHLLNEEELGDLSSQVEVTFQYDGSIADIISSCSITLEGDIAITGSNLASGAHITCGSIANSNLASGSHITCTDITNSRISAGSHITALNITDAISVNAGSHINASGDLSCQSIQADGYVTCRNLNAETINASIRTDSDEINTSDPDGSYDPDELEDLIDQLDDFRDELEDLNDELEDLTDEKDDLIDEIRDLTDELSEEYSPGLMKEINDKTTEMQKLIQTIEEKKAEIRRKSEPIRNWK